jgi:hypothetical protein
MDFLIVFSLKIFLQKKIFQRRFEYWKNNPTFALRF